MAKCENCYHYEACLNSLSENKVLNNTEIFACNRFKDKSLIVELPCSVGDTVYVCYEIPKGVIKTTIKRFEIYDKFTTVVFSNGSQFTVWNNDWKVYKSAVFPSREEAERALEECDKK